MSWSLSYFVKRLSSFFLYLFLMREKSSQIFFYLKICHKLCKLHIKIAVGNIRHQQASDTCRAHAALPTWLLHPAPPVTHSETPQAGLVPRGLPAPKVETSEPPERTSFSPTHRTHGGQVRSLNEPQEWSLEFFPEVDLHPKNHKWTILRVYIFITVFL